MNEDPNVHLSVLRVIGEVLFLYGLLGWTYGVLIQITHPGVLHSGLSHITPWIRVDTFTVISFLLSVIGFFIWRLTKNATKQH